VDQVDEHHAITASTLSRLNKIMGFHYASFEGRRGDVIFSAWLRRGERRTSLLHPGRVRS